MHGTTRRGVDQPWLVMLYALAVLSLLGLMMLGQAPAEVAGWLVPPAIEAGQVRSGGTGVARRGAGMRTGGRWATTCCRAGGRCCCGACSCGSCGCGGVLGSGGPAYGNRRFGSGAARGYGRCSGWARGMLEPDAGRGRMGRVGGEGAAEGARG
jgi:hypothetical protein